MLAPVGVFGRVTNHVALQFVLGLGPVRTSRARERPVIVAVDAVPLQLGRVREDRGANGALPLVPLVTGLPVHDQVVLGGEELALGAIRTRVALAADGVDLALVGLQSGLGVVRPAADGAREVLLPGVQFLVQVEISLVAEFFGARRALELFDPGVRPHVSLQFLGAAERDVAPRAKVISHVNLAAVRVPGAHRVEPGVAELTFVRPLVTLLLRRGRTRARLGLVVVVIIALVHVLFVYDEGVRVRERGFANFAPMRPNLERRVLLLQEIQIRRFVDRRGHRPVGLHFDAARRVQAEDGVQLLQS